MVNKVVQVLNKLKAETIYHEDLGVWTEPVLPKVDDVIQIRDREFTVEEIIDDKERDLAAMGVRRRNLIQIYVSENLPEASKLTKKQAKDQKLKVIRARNKHIKEQMKKVKMRVQRGRSNDGE